MIKFFKEMPLLDKILVIIALVLFIAMLVLEFCPVTHLVRCIVGGLVGCYFLGCLIFFAVRNIIKDRKK